MEFGLASYISLGGPNLGRGLEKARIESPWSFIRAKHIPNTTYMCRDFSFGSDISVVGSLQTEVWCDEATFPIADDGVDYVHFHFV